MPNFSLSHKQSRSETNYDISVSVMEAPPLFLISQALLLLLTITHALISLSITVHSPHVHVAFFHVCCISLVRSLASTAVTLNKMQWDQRRQNSFVQQRCPESPTNYGSLRFVILDCPRLTKMLPKATPID